MIKWVLFTLAALLIFALIAPRVVSDDAARWHVDPATVVPPDTPNTYLIADHDAVYLPLPPKDALARIDAIAMAEAHVSRLTHDEDNGRATYIQRSTIFGFPDYISVSVEPQGEGSSLSIYSRSRFGYSDFGANKARVERWLANLENG